MSHPQKSQPRTRARACNRGYVLELFIIIIIIWHRENATDLPHHPIKVRCDAKPTLSYRKFLPLSLSLSFHENGFQAPFPVRIIFIPGQAPPPVRDAIPLWTYLAVRLLCRDAIRSLLPVQEIGWSHYKSLGLIEIHFTKSLKPHRIFLRSIHVVVQQVLK